MVEVLRQYTPLIQDLRHDPGERTIRFKVLEDGVCLRDNVKMTAFFELVNGVVDYNPDEKYCNVAF